MSFIALGLAALAFFCLPFLLFAGDAPAPGAASASAPPAASSIQWWLPVIVPMLVAGLKALWPSIPKVILPVLCPLLGIAANYLSSFAGVAFDPASAAALGALGVFLREVVDQAKKGVLSDQDMTAPVRGLAGALLLVCGVMTAQAQSPVLQKDSIVLSDQLFRAGEFSIDGGAVARTPDLDTFQSGAVFGGNYFPWRCVGFFGEAQSESLTHSTIDYGGFGLVGRLPLERLHLAPQFDVGSEFDFERDRWNVFAGIGAEARFKRNVGLVAEIRGVRPLHDATKEHLALLFKLRGTF